MTPREERGLVIAAMCKLTKGENGCWLVPSQTGADKKYVVDPDHDTCTCPDHQEMGVVCKHVFAVKFVQKREVASDGSVTETRSVTFTEKKKYTQRWAEYNLAQQKEKHRFQILLRDLCQGVPEPPRAQNGGRPPIPIADRLFATTYKVYSTVSSRRFNCDLQDAHRDGFLSRPLHCNKINTLLENPDLTGPLHALIHRSALPLKSVETHFAADATGFSCGRHVRWHDEKWGAQRSGRDWVKVHAAVGTKTHIITAVAIYGRHTNECPILPELVKTTGQNFTPQEWTADKEYLSVANIETIFAQGAMPYIPFKVDSTGGSGGLFERMFHLFQFNRDQYMEHYHRRSNIESVFSAVKRLFGDYIRSRTDVAMKNEALCKLLAYNLTSVIHSHCELGIEPVFWPEEAESTARVNGQESAGPVERRVRRMAAIVC
jgi:transposase